MKVYEKSALEGLLAPEVRHIALRCNKQEHILKYDERVATHICMGNSTDLIAQHVHTNKPLFRMYNFRWLNRTPKQNE